MDHTSITKNTGTFLFEKPTVTSVVLHVLRDPKHYSKAIFKSIVALPPK